MKNKSLPIIIISILLIGIGFYVLNSLVTRNTTPIPAGATNPSCLLSLSIKPPVTPPPPTPTGTPPIVVCNKKLDIALVIDRSSTMTQKEPDGRQKLAWARDAATTFVNALKGTGTTSVRVSVDSFGAQGNDGTGILTPEYNSNLNIALTNNFGNILTALTGVVYSKPGTCIQCGIRIGNKQLTNTANRRIEILLSDGMANHDWAGHDSKEIPSSSPNPKVLAINEANDGRSKGIEYKVIGYGQNVKGQLDQATLLSIAGNSSIPLGYK